MSLSRWQTVSQLFEAALELPPHGRENFVREACGGDTELESEVLRLLAADEKAGSFLERPALSTLPAQNRLAASPPLPAGSVVAGRFQIVRFIGQGGMGQVYEALDVELNSRIALKAIRPDIAADPRMLSRFRREVQLTRMITHPNVCRTFDIERHVSASSDPTSSQSGDLMFLTMELLEGETLSARLRRAGRFMPSEALPLALQMIDALAAAHVVGVIHRDFKPSNVLLVQVAAGKSSASRRESGASSGSSTARSLRVVVTDFGLARAIAIHTKDDATESGPVAMLSSLTGDQDLMGTLVYMAPEQFERGEASVASDIYSLGLVLFEMITGQRPFADDLPFAEAAKRLKQPAPRAASVAPEIPAAWDAAISRCLAVDPRDRFESVQQVTAGLQDPVSAALPPPVAGLETVSKPKRRSPPRKILAAAAIVAVMLSLSALAFRHYWMKAEEARLAEGSTVLLTDIQNGTGDARFDSTTELVRRQLLQSPYFSLMDSEKIQKTLEEMTKPSAALDPPIAREVAMRNGVRRVVFGTVSRVGDSYVLDLDIEQPDNSPLRFRQHWQNHWTWSMSGGTNTGISAKDMPTGFLDAIRDSSDWIRHEIGESANDIARLSAPPEDVTTANWDALSQFVQAEEFRAARNNEATVEALHKAVAADPNFALGYARLGDVLISLQQYAEGYAAYNKALALGPQRLTRRERDRISGIYASDTWDYAKADESFEDYTNTYKHDYLGWFYRGATLLSLGHVEAAIDSLKTAASVDPTKMHAPAHIARFELILGNFGDAAKWIQRVRETSPEDADFIEGESAFLQGRYQDSENLFKRLKASKIPIYQSYGYSLLARLYAEQGLYQNALAQIEQGIIVDHDAGDRAHEADKTLDHAYINCRLGQIDSCISDTQSALSLDRSLPRLLSAATLLGQAAFEAKAAAKATIAARLRTIEANLPEEDVGPISGIVREHVTGERALAEGQWELALEQFNAADMAESPLSDKEYRARALLAAAEHTPGVSGAEPSEQALASLSTLASRPGLIWQDALAYGPGYLSMQTNAYAKAAEQTRNRISR